MVKSQPICHDRDKNKLLDIVAEHWLCVGVTHCQATELAPQITGLTCSCDWHNLCQTSPVNLSCYGYPILKILCFDKQATDILRTVYGGI